MLAALKKAVVHYPAYFLLILILCVAIFPVVILYGISSPLGKFLDTVFPRQKFGEKMENVWTAIGKPYDAALKRMNY
jgi:hypothetical protein